ncbi:MAG: hypothetical protein WKF40_05805 [Thermoleophilaceae bacterium]
MDKANFKRAALAAGAGFAGAVLLYAFVHLFGPIELGGGSLFGTSAEENRRLWIQLITTQLLPYLLVLGISGALPARALGIGWRRAFASSLMAYVAATVVTIVVSLLLELLVTVRETQFGALVLAFTTALALVFATRIVSWSLIGVDGAVVLVVFLLAPIFGGYVGLLAWVILPFVFALIVPERGD